MVHSPFGISRITIFARVHVVGTRETPVVIDNSEKFTRFRTASSRGDTEVAAKITIIVRAYA